MRIGNSCMTMASERSYKETKVAQTLSTLSFKAQGFDLEAGRTAGVNERVGYNSNGTKRINSLAELKGIFLEMLLERWEKKTGCMGQRCGQTDRISQGISQGMANAEAIIAASGVYVKETVSSFFYSEQETTAFSTKGSVTTKDGRSFDINFTFEMSRSFEVAYEEYTREEVMLCDPLVINFNGDVTELSDQKFLFDLDCDGEAEEISHFASNSGFLALDNNGDGIINDGSELFGTKSGNGFDDLAKFDLDKNGWIDEDDDVFSKLKVWTKDEDGNNILMSIKDAGVGAIFLGTVNTKFALNNLVDNSTNGVIQKSGVYLMEDGEVNTIMHVDFAV